jgi:ArsR family transcriptional regulator
MQICAYSLIKGDDIMQDLIKTFKALSDETRLRILNIIVQRECCVCEVMQALNISQSRASRNLRILEDAGFLKSHREGVWVHYTLSDEPSSNFATGVAKMTSELSARNALLRTDKARLKRAVKMGKSESKSAKGNQK